MGDENALATHEVLAGLGIQDGDAGGVSEPLEQATTDGRSRLLARVLLIVAGVASIAGGFVIAGHGVAYLLAQTALLPWLIRFGPEYLDVMIPSVLILVGGALLAFVGLGLIMASLNLGWTRRR
ncbi:hypothetical protein SK224_00330 [Microbacterium sp. BG28]|uniref:hypothetical protein n=1 Tax=Microbacterium sp. BG28 TaxID=3097356 RepID=UPI002A5A7941|nr:hypothetical protein [Microbacterium sp. BG28]MDY0827565.1 hypothetical protein [Microbacterium sp. BG28]